MRRLLSSKSPLVAGAIPFLIWVAGAHVFVGYVAVMQAMGYLTAQDSVDICGRLWYFMTHEAK